MAFYRNKAGQKIPVYAWDSTASAPKSGDALNITAVISLDGGIVAVTGDVNPSELDAISAPGVYLFDVALLESDADMIVVYPVSSTPGVKLDPVVVYTEPEIRSADVVEVSAGAQTEIADGILKRDWTLITGVVPSRSTLNALRFLRNKWATGLGNTLTVTEEDDLTTAWTAALSSAPGDPVTGMDPT